MLPAGLPAPLGHSAGGVSASRRYPKLTFELTAQEAPPHGPCAIVYSPGVATWAKLLVRDSNFIVRVGGSLEVNEILRDMPNRTDNGTHLVSGGTVEITNSSGITWTFTQLRVR
jgi:hypothetical protein